METFFDSLKENKIIINYSCDDNYIEQIVNEEISELIIETHEILGGKDADWLYYDFEEDGTEGIYFEQFPSDIEDVINYTGLNELVDKNEFEDKNDYLHECWGDHLCYIYDDIFSKLISDQIDNEWIGIRTAIFEKYDDITNDDIFHEFIEKLLRRYNEPLSTINFDREDEEDNEDGINYDGIDPATTGSDIVLAELKDEYKDYFNPDKK